MTPTPPEPEAPRPADETLRIDRLDTSYRFDDELAALLTRFQYRDDGIRLTAEHARPVPPITHTDATPGLQSVFEAKSSLVFVTYDARGHRMVNPIERTLVGAIATTIQDGMRQPVQPDGGAAQPLGEGLAAEDKRAPQDSPTGTAATRPPSLGVVTPHNAQRGALQSALPEQVTANTVEKYQGGERDLIAVSATVSDPAFARREERFILDANRLLVAISRARLLTIVVCSTALFEVAPADSDHLGNGPVWARLFTQAVGRDVEPAWAGELGAFVPGSTDHDDVPVDVYPSTIASSGGGSP